MFDLVGEIRKLITVMMQIEKDLKELIKSQKPEETKETKTGGTKK